MPRVIKTNLVEPTEALESRILTVRDQKVMLDEDIAALYGVSTKRLNEQVKRNARRFPGDFTFRLTAQDFREVMQMRSQSATASKRNVRFPPFVFTEHGALMAASILDSQVAVEMSIAVVRAFVRMRSVLGQNKELARKLEELDRKYSRHDGELKVIFNTLRELMEPAKTRRRRIGF